MAIVIVLLILLVLAAAAAIGFYVYVDRATAGLEPEFRTLVPLLEEEQWAEYLARGVPLTPKVRQAQSLLAFLPVVPSLAQRRQHLAQQLIKLHSNLARAAQATGDPARAKTLLQELIAGGKAESGDYFLLIEILIRENDLAGAEQIAGKLKEQKLGLKDRLRASSGNPDHHFALGLIAAHKGETAAALENFGAMLRLDPKSGPRLLAVADILIGKSAESREVYSFLAGLYEQQNNSARAIECYQKSLTGAPADKPLLEKLAGLHTRAGRWDAALAATEKLLEFEPNSVPLLKNVRQLLEQKGATERLIGVYEQLARLEPEPGIFRALVGLYKNLKRYDDAIKLLIRLIELQPNIADNYFALAEIHMRTGHSEQAILAYEKLMQQDISLADFAMVKQVVESLEGILKAVPGDIAALRLLVQARDKLNLDSSKQRYRLGKALHSAGRTDDAFAVAQQLWKEDSGCKYPAGMLMGLCWLAKDSADLALRHFQTMLTGKVEPDLKREIQYHVGLAHEQSGNWEEARSIYGDILLTALAYRDVGERFERVKKKLEGKRKAAAAAEPGSTITDLNLTRFELREELGKGGMGVVYRAHDTKLDRDVALKVLTGETSEDSSERLIREAQSAAVLNHPNIVGIYDVNDSGPVKYIAMELVDGGSLRQCLDARHGEPLPEPTARRLILEFLDAMTYAHSRGIVHRDIKPENVMLDANQHIKITDFGLARMETSSTITRPGMAVGTVQYMAPEQIRGEKPDPRVDIYAAGCMFYEMLTGKPPFSGTDIASIIYNHLNVEPAKPTEVNPALAPEWDTLVLEMMAKIKENRAQSFAEVAEDIRRLK